MNNITEESTFQCVHCNKLVTDTAYTGTAHRNHCPFCLWSKHVDNDVPGDRASKCHSNMKPIGLTFKHEGVDKYGKIKQGELMIVHICTACRKININRIAGDDNEKIILLLISHQSLTTEIKKELQKLNINILNENQKNEVEKQLFGVTKI